MTKTTRVDRDVLRRGRMMELDEAAVDALGQFDDYLEEIESRLGPWRGRGTERFEVVGATDAKEALHEAVREWASKYLRKVDP
jgi:hypothetical protein